MLSLPFGEGPNVEGLNQTGGKPVAERLKYCVPLGRERKSANMNSRERALAAFAFEKVDKVPRWCGSSVEFWNKAKQKETRPR